MNRKWAGLGRERHDILKVSVMSAALLAFIVVWVMFASAHEGAGSESLVLAGGATNASEPASTSTPVTQSDPPALAPVRQRTSRGS